MSRALASSTAVSSPAVNHRGAQHCPAALLSPRGSPSARFSLRTTRSQPAASIRRAAPGASQVCRAADTEESAPALADDSLSVPKGKVWELDFCSRPLVDEKGKKVWELLVCNPERTFEYAQYFPNNMVNSAEVKKVIAQLLEQDGAERPDKVRYFRGQMQTIITRALTDMDVKIVPSRRCFSLMNVLEERLENVYSVDPRYKPDQAAMYTLDQGSPSDLPDALRGEQWAFVEFPLGALMEEAKVVADGSAFGSIFDLAEVGCGDLDPETLIPGVAVFSRRSVPLAAWTNSLELAGITADTDRACLILETGVNTRWRYGSYRRSPQTNAESEAWEAAKKERRGLHFLAVQSDPEADKCDGFWILQERSLPEI